jgi:hypothetical protein
MRWKSSVTRSILPISCARAHLLPRLPQSHVRRAAEACPHRGVPDASVTPSSSIRVEDVRSCVRVAHYFVERGA